MNIRLSVAAGSSHLTTFEHGGPVICIGRDPECDLALQGEAADKVSRQHARIELSAGGATLSDAGSSNGTLLNDRLLKGPAPLRVGDRIQMGYTGATLTVLELDLDARPVDQATRVRPLLVIGGSGAAVALVVVVVVVVLWLRKPKGPDEYVQGPTAETLAPLPPKTNEPPAPVQPAPEPGKQPSPSPLQPAPGPEKQPATPPQDTEALARGPVHEAYAQPVDYQLQPGPVVAKKPRDPIEELPPDQKPNGVDVQWIPGYWAWDDEGQEYLWVSGFWRDVPPGRHWVPGAWQEVAGGWMWSPGFWASDETQQVDYVPYPPLSADTGPSTPQLQPTDVYAPGCWVWREAQWSWRPGFWVTPLPDLVWTPARYVWTPGGCVFVDGYWDHPLERRGLLLSPARILRQSVVDWTYVSRYVVRTDFLMGALFVGPARRHYHFGDYYTETDVKRKFVAWIDYQPTKGSYDALYSHYRLVYRDAPAWEYNLRALYVARYKGEVPRPPHTFVQQQTFIENITVNKTANITIFNNVNITRVQSVTALTRLDKDREESVTRLSGLAPGAKVGPAHAIKTQEVSKGDRTGEKPQIRYFQESAQKRSEHEARMLEAGTVHVKPAEQPKAAQLEVPKAQVVRLAPVVKPPPLPVLPKCVVRPHEQPKPPPPPEPPKRRHK